MVTDSGPVVVNARDLPSSWKLVRLADVATTSSGGTPSRGRADFYGGPIPWVKSGELRDRIIYETEESISKEGLAASSAKLFPKGTVCIALYGATVGRLGILGVDAATNQAVCGIFPDSRLEPRYLYRFLESRRRDLIDQGKGGAQSNISQAIVRDIPIPLPPFTEQQRIVEEIEKQFTRLDVAVAALKRVRANLKRYRAAAIQGCLAHTESLADVRLLRELIQGLQQGWSPKCDLTRDPSLEEWAIIATTAVQPLRYDDKQAKPLPAALKPRYHIEIKEGDFLMTRKGPRRRAGVSCLVRSTRPRLMICDTVYRFRCSQDVFPPFLEIALNSPQVVSEIDSRKSGISDSGVSLTHKKLGTIPIPLPPLPEQQRIVVEIELCLSVADKLERLVDTNLQRAKNLHQSILKRAFSGEL